VRHIQRELHKYAAPAFIFDLLSKFGEGLGNVTDQARMVNRYSGEQCRMIELQIVAIQRGSNWFLDTDHISRIMSATE
jgi:hypothetical protein